MSTVGPAAQVWVGEALWDTLSAEQQAAVVAARTFTFGRYPDVEATSPKAAVNAIARQSARDAVVRMAADLSEGGDQLDALYDAAGAFDRAQAALVKATAASQALAAMVLSQGASEVYTARALGINRNTLRRWIGKLQTPVSRRR